MNQMPDFSRGQNGLLPVIAQDAENGEVLMLAWANREAFEKTLETGRATYWSRSRKGLWVKGDTSGHVQEIVKVAIDCDGDAILYKVKQTGAACHEGYRSCFFRVRKGSHWETVQEKLPDSGGKGSHG